MIPRGSEFTGQNLKRLKFRERFQLIVLAINRHGINLLSKMSTVKLRFGDVLLLQGRREHVEQLAADAQILLLEEISDRQARPEKRPWALLAFGLFLTLSITHVVPLSVAVLSGVLVLLASRAVRAREIYEMIEWRLIVLIACMISFGQAMEATHADQYLADLIVRATGHYGPLAVLSGFFLMTVALTQPMSNQAAALVMLPIAVKTALVLGLNPRTFAVTVTYAASCYSSLHLSRLACLSIRPDVIVFSTSSKWARYLRSRFSRSLSGWCRSSGRCINSESRADLSCYSDDVELPFAAVPPDVRKGCALPARPD